MIYISGHDSSPFGFVYILLSVFIPFFSLRPSFVYIYWEHWSAESCQLAALLILHEGYGTGEGAPPILLYKSWTPMSDSSSVDFSPFRLLFTDIWSIRVLRVRTAPLLREMRKKKAQWFYSGFSIGALPSWKEHSTTENSHAFLFGRLEPRVPTQLFPRVLWNWHLWFRWANVLFFGRLEARFPAQKLPRALRNWH